MSCCSDGIGDWVESAMMIVTRYGAETPAEHYATAAMGPMACLATDLPNIDSLPVLKKRSSYACVEHSNLSLTLRHTAGAPHLCGKGLLSLSSVATLRGQVQPRGLVAVLTDGLRVSRTPAFFLECRTGTLTLAGAPASTRFACCWCARTIVFRAQTNTSGTSSCCFRKADSNAFIRTGSKSVPEPLRMMSLASKGERPLR